MVCLARLSRSIVLPFAGLVAGLVAACDQGPSVINEFHRGDVWSRVVYASTDGPVLVQILSTPSGFDKSAADRVIVDAMSRSLSQLIVRFTDDPSLAPRPRFRVILVFDPEPGFGPGRLCEGDQPQIVRRDDRINITAVACSDDERWSQVRGHVGTVNDPSDRLFVELIKQVTLELLQR